jgi:hypothetical protein
MMKLFKIILVVCVLTSVFSYAPFMGRFCDNTGVDIDKTDSFVLFVKPNVLKFYADRELTRETKALTVTSISSVAIPNDATADKNDILQLKSPQKLIINGNVFYCVSHMLDNPMDWVRGDQLQFEVPKVQLMTGPTTAPVMPPLTINTQHIIVNTSSITVNTQGINVNQQKPSEKTCPKPEPKKDGKEYVTLTPKGYEDDSKVSGTYNVPIVTKNKKETGLWSFLQKVINYV